MLMRTPASEAPTSFTVCPLSTVRVRPTPRATFWEKICQHGSAQVDNSHAANKALQLGPSNPLQVSYLPAVTATQQAVAHQQNVATWRPRFCPGKPIIHPASRA